MIRVPLAYMGSWYDSMGCYSTGEMYPRAEADPVFRSLREELARLNSENEALKQINARLQERVTAAGV